MFENIIGQKRVINSLKKDILQKSLPRSLLFEGAPYTGKVSTALELARVLDCEKTDADWSCNCRSCELHRQLVHQGLLMLGPRYFTREISATADVFKRSSRLSSRYLFIRAVRKLTRRFDSIIWDGDREKLRKAGEYLVEMEEILDIIQPGRPLPDAEKLDIMIEKVVELSSVLSKYIPKGNIPVSQLRNAFTWAHETGNYSKVLLIENADTMQAASQNSLLKLLEEPPPNVYIILTSTRGEVLFPTILSRLRRYRFQERTGAEVKFILKRIFHEDSENEHFNFSSFQEYFRLWAPIQPGILRSQAKNFLKNLARSDWVFEIDPKIDGDKEAVLLLIRQIADFIYSPAEAESIGLELPSEKVSHLSRILSNIYNEIDELNIKPSLALKNLYYTMKGVI